jgi:hypothetical protein
MKVGGMGMYELGCKQAALFEIDNITYCEVRVTCYTPRQILLYAYHSLVRQRKIIPIEELLIEDKEIAWRTAKEFAKGRLGKKALIEVAQALLTLEYFLNLKKN